MIAVTQHDDGMIGRATRHRLAAFARTLRHNGFKVGLAETRDALAILASPAATRPGSLKGAFRALFCATHSDWEKFDQIFEAFWRGRDMRTARVLGGGSPGKATAKRIGEADTTQSASALPDHAPAGL